MGWPWKGSDTPVLRPPDWPITVPTASTRRAVVNLPLACRSCGASGGAAITVCAGSTACPASVAGYACWARAVVEAAISARAAQVARGESRVMEGSTKKGAATMPPPDGRRVTAWPPKSVAECTAHGVDCS